MAWSFCCRRCRTELFTDSEVVPHESSARAAGHKRFRHQGFHEHASTLATAPAASDAVDAAALGVVCTSAFLDPDATPWVAAASRDPGSASAGEDENGGGGSESGTIRCPKCEAKVGAHSWVGSQCSCGAWVTPAFQIHLRAVDRMPSAPPPPPPPPPLLAAANS